MVQSYLWNHQMTLHDDLLTAANLSLLGVTPVNEQVHLVLIKPTKFCALPLSKL